MKTSLKLLTHRKNNKGESPLFVRVRGKNSQGKFVESSINTDLDIDSKHFDGGVLKSRTPNYTNKQRIINSMIDLISSIIGESKEEGLEPTPQYIKVQYEKRKELKQIRTEVETPEMVQNHSFWKVWKEYWKTKKNTSYGYRKTKTQLRII